MEVTYIDHSGFFLEMQEVCFLFDYYRGEIPEVKGGKPLAVFVSHKHGDHYNADIFELVRKYPDVRFVLSKDIRPKRKIQEYMEKGIDLESRIVTAAKNTAFDMVLSNGKKLEIETLRSTDEGVAYILTCEGKTIYHAGDLNLWVWEGESKQYNNNMRADYYRELEKLKNRKIDVAFVPLDPRLASHAMEGLESFMEYTYSNYVFPMHFWGEYSIILSFFEKHSEYRDQIIEIKENGQKFFIK